MESNKQAIWRKENVWSALSLFTCSQNPSIQTPLARGRSWSWRNPAIWTWTKRCIDEDIAKLTLLFKLGTYSNVSLSFTRLGMSLAQIKSGDLHDSRQLQVWMKQLQILLPGNSFCFLNHEDQGCIIYCSSYSRDWWAELISKLHHDSRVYCNVTLILSGQIRPIQRGKGHKQ